MGTVEERIARLEQRADDRDAVLIRMESKIDTLLEAMNMGKGAWKAMLKLGAVLVAILGGGAWLWQNVLSPLLTSKH